MPQGGGLQSRQFNGLGGNQPDCVLAPNQVTATVVLLVGPGLAVGFRGSTGDNHGDGLAVDLEDRSTWFERESENELLDTLVEMIEIHMVHDGLPMLCLIVPIERKRGKR